MHSFRHPLGGLGTCSLQIEGEFCVHGYPSVSPDAVYTMCYFSDSVIKQNVLRSAECQALRISKIGEKLSPELQSLRDP
jgi:hypothetical protein